MDPVYEIPTRNFVRYFGSPMQTHAWDCPTFTARDVRRFIAEGKLESQPWDGAPNTTDRKQDVGCDSNDYHIARVAYMVVYPQIEPICLDVSEYSVRLEDGNHRLCAAIVRRDKMVRATFGGFVDQFFRTFRSARQVS